MVGEAEKKRWIREQRGEQEKGEGTEKGENRRERGRESERE